MNEERKCPVCDSQNWETLVEDLSGKIMTGDQRIGPGKLHKIICSTCGLAANKSRYTQIELETLYGDEYELNTYGREEHLFFTNSGAISRSQVFCDWISGHIPSSTKELIEIGCGEGMLLSKISERNPKLQVTGIDGSTRAVELARQKGLNVKQKLILDSNDKLPKVDCLLLINVIEHVEDLSGVFEALRNSLNENGKVIFCLPIQDYGGYDIVFAEHVWHFTVNHFKRILQKHNFIVEHLDSEHPINHGIGLFVCSIGNSDIIPYTNQSSVILNAWSKWQEVFKRTNDYLHQLEDNTIAIFGSGEVLTLLLTFTNLSDYKIEFIIDETPSKIGTQKHGIPIVDLGALTNTVVNDVLVTTNPKYKTTIATKMQAYNLNVQFL